MPPGQDREESVQATRIMPARASGKTQSVYFLSEKERVCISVNSGDCSI